MAKILGRKSLSVLMISLMVMSTFMMAVTAEIGSPEVLTVNIQELEYTNEYLGGEGVSNILPQDNADEALSKIQSSLRPIAEKGGKDMIKVIVWTTSAIELTSLLENYDYRGAIGTRLKGEETLTAPVLYVPIYSLMKIASLPSVIAIYEYPTFDSPEFLKLEESMRSIGGGTHVEGTNPSDPNMIFAGQQHSAQKAWANDFIGSGVKVAMCDTGVDFAHPDLQGTQARDLNIYTIDNEIVIESAEEGERYALVGSTLVSFINETLIENAIGGETYFYLPHRNIHDCGFKLYINNTEQSTGNYTVSLPSGKITLTTPIQLETNDTVVSTYAYYKIEKRIVPASYKVYKNNTLMSNGYTLDLNTGNLTFTESLQQGNVIEVTYDYYSPYYGWPICFDPSSMGTYISTGYADDTWYVNTTYSTDATVIPNYPEIDSMVDWNVSKTYSQSWEPLSAGDDESQIITGLTPDKQYCFAIVGEDEASQKSLLSNSPNGTAASDTTPPNRIIDLTAEPGPDDGTVLLNWTAPGDDGDSGEAVSYTVKFSTLPIPNWVCFEYVAEEYNNYWVPKASGEQESYLLIDLTAGIEHYFSIEAIDEANNNALPSNDPSAIVTIDTTPPSAITDLTAELGPDHGSVRLNWTAPGDDGNSGTVTSYDIRRSFSLINQSNFDAATPCASPTTPKSAGDNESFILSGLTPDVPYYFAIEALDETNNRGDLSTPHDANATALNDVTPPGKVTDLTATNLTAETDLLAHTTILLNWTAPGDDNTTGGPCSKYIIKFSTNQITNQAEFNSATTYPFSLTPKPSSPDTNESMVTIMGLFTLGTRYYFAIEGVDEANNQGDVSTNPDGYCANSTPCNDVIDPGQVNDLSASTGIDHKQVILTWTAVGDDAMDGRVYDYLVKRSSSPIITESDWKDNSTQCDISPAFTMKPPVYPGLGEEETRTVLRLTPGEKYYFAVRARDETTLFPPNPTGPLSLPNDANATAQNDAVAPGQVIDLTIETGPCHGSVWLNWTAPDDDEGTGTGKADKYIVKYREAIYEYKYVKADVKQIGVLNPVLVGVNYNITGIDSKSGIYHLGDHTDENIAHYVNNFESTDFNYSKVLVVDSTSPMVYDTVYVDLDYDKDFSDEKPCTIGDEISWRDLDGNGLADLSGGMIYFIADGETPIPYSDVYCERQSTSEGVVENVIPGNGELVCFFGEFAQDATRGTERASAVVGRGKVPYPDDPSGHPHPVLGIAPNATLIAIAGVLQDSWLFAVDGYDGLPGTGDEAQIVSVGVNIPTAYEDGWDVYSRYLDWIAVEYAKGSSSFVVGSGVNGYGYGTVTAPASAPSAITVGSATNFYYRVMSGGTESSYDGGPNPSYGDIIPASGRGPSMLGHPKPDVVTMGFFAHGDLPLYSTYTSEAISEPMELWNGADLASSTAAGILAMVYEAYFDANHLVVNETVLIAKGNERIVQVDHHPVVESSYTIHKNDSALEETDYTFYLNNGTIVFEDPLSPEEIINVTYEFTKEFPNLETSKSILMSGAEDIHYDVLCQGAGYANTELSTNIAANKDGLLITPSSWVPGDYRGVEYGAFAKIVTPSTNPDHLEKTFTVENHDIDDPATVEISAGEMRKTGEAFCSIDINEGDDGWTIINSTGVYNKTGSKIASYDTDLWNASLLKVTSFADVDIIDPNHDGAMDLQFWMELHDWTDCSPKDGKLNGDNPTPRFGTGSGVGWGERNRMTACYAQHSNVLESRIHDPSERTHDGLIVWSRYLGGKGNATWCIKFEFYDREDWSWIEFDKNIATINPGGIETFTATVNIPDDAGIGSYEGAICIKTTEKTTIVPILINVAANKPKFTIGGGTSFEALDEVIIGNYTNESSAQFAYNNIIPDSYTIYQNETALVEYGYCDIALYAQAMRELVVINNRTVTNESVINATGGETSAQLAHGQSPLEDICPDTYRAGSFINTNTYSLYLNGIEMVESYEGETVDYTLDLETGNITFSAPLSPGMEITADYEYYNPTLRICQLNHTDIWTAGFILSVSGTHFLYGSDAFDLYPSNGTVILKDPLGPGDFVQAIYWYGTYEIDLRTGIVTFLREVTVESTITASYSYRDSETLYNNGAVYGGSGTAGQAGDWRFYYVDIPEEGLFTDPSNRFLINIKWDNMYCDIDAFGFGQTAQTSLPVIGFPSKGALPSERYGPYTLTNFGGSTEAAGFFTASGEAEEYSSPELKGGLNVIAMRNVLSSGIGSMEGFSGEVGTMKVNPSQLKILTNSLSGSTELRTVSNLDWEGKTSGMAAGPSAPESYKNMTVYQDDPDWSHFPDFISQLASGNTSIYVTLKDCLIFDVHIYGHVDFGYEDVADLDLGIFLDANGDGETQPEEFAAMDADADADEHVKLIQPVDGDYIIRVYGFTLLSLPAHYDVDITNVAGKGFGVEGEGVDLTPDSDDNDKFISEEPLAKNTPCTLSISWDLQGAKDGTLMGALYIGPGNAPMALLIPIDLTIDTTPPVISDLGINVGEGLQVNYLDDSTTNDNMPIFSASVYDWDRGELDPSSGKLYLDDVDVTSLAKINIPFADPDGTGATGGPLGYAYWLGTMTYIPTKPLSDEVHKMRVEVKDSAGNLVSKEWMEFYSR
jgi:hypothetical protein